MNKQGTLTRSQEENQEREINSEMTQMLKLAQEDLKAPIIINILNSLQEIIVMKNEDMWKISRKAKTNK